MTAPQGMQMAYTYLVTNSATGEQQLVEASSPSIAIADAAEKSFTAERVQGGALAILAKSMPVRKVGGTRNPAPAASAPAAAGEPAGGEPAAEPNKSEKPDGKAGK